MKNLKNMFERALIEKVSASSRIQNLFNKSSLVRDFIGKVCISENIQTFFQENPNAYKWYKRNHVFAFKPDTILVNKKDVSDLKIISGTEYTDPLPKNHPIVIDARLSGRSDYADRLTTLDDSEYNDDLYAFADGVPEEVIQKIKNTWPGIQLASVTSKAIIERDYRPL